MLSQSGEFRPINGWGPFGCLGHPINSQTLRRWAQGAIYIRQGGLTLGIGPHSSLWITFNLSTILIWCCNLLFVLLFTFFKIYFFIFVYQRIAHSLWYTSVVIKEGVFYHNVSASPKSEFNIKVKCKFNEKTSTVQVADLCDPSLI